jgi:hypothetical protein
VAPHLEVADAQGHAIVIHAGGDNFSDQPAPLGGGGARIACGVVKQGRRPIALSAERTVDQTVPRLAFEPGTLSLHLK